MLTRPPLPQRPSSSGHRHWYAAGPLARHTRGWLLAATVLIAGCGGGGGGGTAASASAAPSNADPTPMPTLAASVAASAVDTTTITQLVASTAQTASDAAVVATAQVAAEAAATAAAAAVTAEAAAATSSEKTTASTGSALADAPTQAPATAAAGPASNANGTPVLTVRARGSLAAGVGPQMEVRIDGSVIGTVQVTNSDFGDYNFTAPTLAAGAKVDIVFTNDAVINGQDRNLYLAYVAQGAQLLMPTAGNSLYDRGAGAKAFDGLDVIAGQSTMAWGGALRLTWPAAAAADAQLARKQDAVRFLTQATFGPTLAEVEGLAAKTYDAWLTEQMAMAVAPEYVNHVQAWFNRGDAYRPRGASYNANRVGQKFWQSAASSPDQLRKRVAFALHQIFMVSQVDSNLWYQSRAYAAYLDLLNKHAFGNYRALLEDIALSPAMGIYLSHMRNRKEDPATGRMPDENFAREIMQLFSIGLHELNADGTAKLNGSGQPIETYTNADVMALAKVFTGWSWAFADGELTESKFRWGNPDLTSAAADQRIDLLPMKAYPGQHSTAAKTLFAGKPWATAIPANGSAQADLKQALDTLFNHPNVGPFIGRQLIQRLVTSQPSPAYVARVAAVFNNNGSGVRGDLGAVVRAILLDSEARAVPPTGFGKLREPVLRVAQWMRALGAQSASGQYLMDWELDKVGQRAMYAPSVFGYYRPGYVPPNTDFTGRNATAPEFQIVDESTVAAWINTAEAMAGSGLGWTGSANDVAVDYTALGALASNGNVGALVDRLNLLLLGGRMSAALRQAILDTAGGVSAGTNADAYRARAAVFLTLASPEYLSQP